MAVCLVHDAPGVTRAQYEQVHDEVTPGNRLPPGLLYHAAGPTENGWCVVEVWESQEALGSFFQEKLQQALQRAGIGGQPRIFEVVNTMQP
jgi:quinol monooxygenase YgiN